MDYAKRKVGQIKSTANLARFRVRALFIICQPTALLLLGLPVTSQPYFLNSLLSVTGSLYPPNPNCAVTAESIIVRFAAILLKTNPLR